MSISEILNKPQLEKADIIALLAAENDDKKLLFDKALQIKLKHLDNYVHLRGLIEYSNICTKSCLYCGVRSKNPNFTRYQLNDEEVIECAKLAHELGYGSVALQSGERCDKDFTDKITHLVKEIKKIDNGSLGITLSLGEQTEAVYREWMEAGAHRYLLRIEASNEELYYKIHPRDEKHSFKKRLDCIDTLLKLGYQTGTGVMVGLPFQTLDDLADDLLFFQKKNVAMVGMGPFIPHPDTPLWQHKDEIPSAEKRMELTLKMIAILRLMMPEINMVAATANQTVDPMGREKAIAVGANVIMPNLTPNEFRENYLIYPDKACVKDKPDQCQTCLDVRLAAIGHKVLYNAWGDSVAFTKDQHSNHANTKKIAIIAGAGPAGLTAAYELLQQTGIKPIVCEITDAIGGISRTVQYKGNRMDIGGHRFFSKNEEVTRWWQQMMPLQNKPAKDDLLLQETEKAYAPTGPDPEHEDRVMLIRRRVSRIFFLRKFFDYPISMKKDTFVNMGFRNMVKAGFGYLWACIHKLPETSLENFYINRFGRPLYEMFFEAYTEKVWGVHPSKLGADWGSQRVKGLSVRAVMKDMWNKAIGKKDSQEVETSLIEQFVYPKYGPGQLWETVATEIGEQGGEIRLQTAVTRVHLHEGNVKSVTVRHEDGSEEDIACDYFLSTMPLKDLIPALSGITIPENVKEVAAALPYRDFITVGLLVNKMKIKNQTKLRTYSDRVPDTWIYIQERDVHIGRLQVFNNWSPYLVNDYENTLWIGLEYFCTEGDEMWTMHKDDFIKMAIDELAKIDIIEKEAVLDACLVRTQKAYPAYYGAYYELNTVKDFLNTIPNLFCIGRNGQHRYNNMDHSMLTAFEAVRNIKAGKLTDKENVWSVNTETEYHESK